MSSTVVASWETQTALASVPDKAKVLDYRAEGKGDSVQSPDRRVLVDAKDFAPRGQYRGVVKLFCQYSRQDQGENAPWAMGTGWLIKDDIIVTAGHNAYDWKFELGPVARIKAYIGYYGKTGLGDPSVQYRTVTRVTTTVGWLSGRENKRNDISFMQVSPPFTGIAPYKFTDTPVSGDDVIGVVGYPGDKFDRASQEKGARMYHEFRQVKWNRQNSEQNMLEYPISTFGGNSGCPVFRQDGLIGIGVHTYGGDVNLATCIGASMGNLFPLYLHVFSLRTLSEVPRPSTVPDITKKIKYYEFSNDQDQEPLSSDPEQEDFIDIISKALTVGGNIDSLAGPYGMMAGTALSAIGSLIAGSRTESAGLDKVSLENSGIQERALLNDACLHTVYQMSPERRKAFGIDDSIQTRAPRIYNEYKQLAPHIEKFLRAPALDIAVSIIKERAKPKQESIVMPSRRTLSKISGTESTIPPADSSIRPEFIQAMLEPTIDYSSAGGMEGFFNELGPLLQKALVVAKPIHKSTAAGALDDVVKKLNEVKGGLDSEPSEMLTGVVQRAAVGAAACDALQYVDPSDLREEGIFDGIKSFIQVVGPLALQHGPGIISNVAGMIQALTKASAPPSSPYIDDE